MTHPPQPIRVIKLGGSLLSWPQLADEFRRWLSVQPAVSHAIVVGGGELADAIRRLDQIHGLSPRDAHWLAAETMQITAKLVATLLPEARIQQFDDYASNDCALPTLTILDAWQFLRDVEPGLSGTRLSENWDTTSDSIAARFAIAIGASELVVLKSALPGDRGDVALSCQQSPDTWLECALSTGFVDAAFAEASRGLRSVRCVNLRDPSFSECWLRRAERHVTRSDG